MDNYITGNTIKTLREKKGLTQAQLAQLVGVSDKAVSKWETAKGLPDITLIEPLAKELSVSVMELFSGDKVANKNVCANILRSKFYVCPICNNVVRAMGDAVISCCGICLPALLAEEADSQHQIKIQKVEDEHFITVDHEMTKEHFISFVAFVGFDRILTVRLYPEQAAFVRFPKMYRGKLYFYCNNHGLFEYKI